MPDAIGGRLTAKILCKQCNDYAGRTIIDRLRFDPSFRMGVENLKAELDESLYDKLMERQQYVAKNERGP